MNLFFCACTQRSGSTLLTRILNGHSKIAAPFEIPTTPYFLGSNLENKCLDKALQISKLIGIDPKMAIEDQMGFFRAIADYENKEALVIKQPANSRHLLRFFIDFGDVPLIHIVRDVRQVCQSKALLQDQGSHIEAIRYWFRHNEEIQKYSKYFSRVFRLRYEDLVSEPEATMRQLLDFMGYQFEDSMIDYWNNDHSDDKVAMWDGMKPKRNVWSKELYKGKIEGKFREPQPEVLQLYAGSPRLRAMNEGFGYE
ncbi:MAG: sulfotransferase [Alphaproteobacteria bacterium]|nr:MAG: sulfotransferase [Alphaproteobacteria bacterium]